MISNITYCSIDECRMIVEMSLLLLTVDRSSVDEGKCLLLIEIAEQLRSFF